ncbi:hypothetical protein Zm00014a_014299 [Zea mays]|uniref:Uncharacterized protein n=1 Tax=Zea mays TaxID=4577 RepID=A0A3L6EG73_MAIZE|nr:hypothetical protein Zm00014a_014299 [Zea mays]
MALALAFKQLLNRSQCISL